MPLSNAHPGITALSEGLGPAARVAGLCSLGLHGAALIWFLGSGGGVPETPASLDALETPIYVTLVAETAPPPQTMEIEQSVEPQQDAIPPAPAPKEPEENEAAIEDPPTPEEVLEPKTEPEEVLPQATAQLLDVSPPERPRRPPARPAKQAVKAATAPAVPPAGPAAPKKPATVQQPKPQPRHAADYPTTTRADGPGLFNKPVTFPDYLANPAPNYPRSELRRRREGRVELTVQVSAKGRAEKISVSRSSGIPAFDEAAVRAVRGWRFLPATRAGQPVPGWVNVPIRFTLKQS